MVNSLLLKFQDPQKQVCNYPQKGKNIVKKIEKLPKESWKTIRVECAGNKKKGH
jgi:hypothetical protein